MKSKGNPTEDASASFHHFFGKSQKQASAHELIICRKLSDIVGRVCCSAELCWLTGFDAAAELFVRFGASRTKVMPKSWMS